MFEVEKTSIPGCFVLKPQAITDVRGSVVKTFHHEFYRENGIATDFREQFYTTSHQGVIRGLHFQSPPHECCKLAYCTEGTVLDIVLDIRNGSPSYGTHISREISADNAAQVYIPAGCAHGFYVYSRRAIMVYNVTSVYSQESDDGIRWDSAGIDWPIDDPVVSDRDNRLPGLDEMDSPFYYSCP